MFAYFLRQNEEEPANGKKQHIPGTNKALTIKQ